MVEVDTIVYCVIFGRRCLLAEGHPPPLSSVAVRKPAAGFFVGVFRELPHPPTLALQLFRALRFFNGGQPSSEVEVNITRYGLASIPHRNMPDMSTPFSEERRYGR